MLKNYLKIAWRNLLKHKTFSIINISGLAIGVASCLIIYLYVHSELNYDQDAVDRSRTVRLTSSLSSPETVTRLAVTPGILTSTMRRELPEVESTLRVAPVSPVIKINGDVFRGEDFVKTEPAVFDVFRFQFLEGQAKGALDKPNSIVLSEGLAKKYFGAKPALGQMLTIDGANWIVTAVVKDRPSNTDLKMPALMSGDFEKDKTWIGDLGFWSFVVFRQKPDLAAVGRKLAGMSTKYAKPELVTAGAPDYDLAFQSELLQDVHFSQGKEGDTPKGNRRTIYIFSVLAIFILVIALLNYINLSTAKATERAKEVGIRKVSGAQRWQLIRQFLFESFVVMLISCLLALGLLALMLPYVNALLPAKLEVNWLRELGATGIVFLFSWLLAGLYPAFVLTSFKPVLVLKGNFRQSLKGLWLRKAVTITQFAIAAALILGTTVIYNQMNYIRKKDLGYNKDQIVTVFMPDDSTYSKSVYAFQKEMQSRPEVQGMTVGSRMADEGLQMSSTSAEIDGKKRQMMVNYFYIDTNYLPLLQIKLAEGRNFSESFGTDKEEACIVNEAYVKAIGWKSGIGQFIDRGEPKKRRIVGVVKNYIYRSMHNPVEPLILELTQNSVFNSTTMKMKPAALPLVQSIFKKYMPSLPFDYAFRDDAVNQQYASDRITTELFNDFTVLAIFLSFLGLYGLVALIAVQRTKEIGIRKVLGASVLQLFNLMSRDFLILVGWGLLLALPVSGFLMQKWLSTYAYHIGLGWWMFLVPVLLLIVIAGLTLSREVIKAALVRPAKTLKND